MGNSKLSVTAESTLSNSQILMWIIKNYLQKLMENLWDPTKDKDRRTNSVLNIKKWRKDELRTYKPDRLPSMQVPNDSQLAELLGKINKNQICYWG